MKKLLLLILMVGGSIIYCTSQSNANNNSTSPSTGNLKSKQPSVSGSDAPDNNSNNLVSDPVLQSNSVQFLEYKVDGGSTTVENQADNQIVIFPILAEGYTDPNYELNKQKSLELIQQLQAPATPQKNNEELILDLQTKIKAIKEGEIVGTDAATKLPLYESELQLLLNTKQTKSCVTE